MKDLLPLLVDYLASKTSKVAGVTAFYNEMPDKVDECLCVQEKPTSIGVPNQIDAQTHKITVAVRGATHILANDFAYACYNALTSDASDETTEDTGFIALTDTITVYVWLYGPPAWDRTDTQNRKYYSFNALITTTR